MVFVRKKRDGKKMKLILISLILLSTPAFACGSFEECVEKAKHATISTCRGWYDVGISDDECLHRGPPTEYVRNYVSRLNSKALAFKLEEISKTLDK